MRLGIGEPVLKFVAHSATVLRIASAHGWHAGARYTNLRDIRNFERVGFLDIDWKNYNFEKHIQAAILTKPFMTVAQDVEDKIELTKIIDQAYLLLEHCKFVIIVPKDPLLQNVLTAGIPSEFILGYSVPTRYGGTRIPPSAFRRPVHLLGGRPDIQRRLADQMPVVSIDVNRFTLDAAFGDYFDGSGFRPHPVGGYQTCLTASVSNINAIWNEYRSSIESYTKYISQT